MNTEPIIAIEGLSHSFGKGNAARTVLIDVDIHFYPGEIAIVTGPSGSGKTTLLTLAGALRSPQSGSVKVAGRELNGATGRTQLAVRRKIGFIFQHHNLLESLSAVENVQMGLEHEAGLPKGESRRRALDMLERVGLSDHAAKPPSALSGGQRQRVAIARALVRDPAIVMADEPTAALDSHSGREIVDLLHKLAREQGCSILLVTHDNRILDVADRILMLDDGRIEESSRALERLKKNMAATMQAIARYPALLGGAGGADAEPQVQQVQVTRKQIEDARRTAGALAARKWGESLLRRTAALAEAAEMLYHIEASSRTFCAAIALSGAVGTGSPADRLFQSLEFLLLSAGDALALEDIEDTERLAAMTGDRGEMMKTLREKQCDALGPEHAGTVGLFYDLTDVFSRLVYFLHGLARCWKEMA
ncbi:MAG TPA: hypothetical protein DCS43_15590 [Verrucomicrobia bacterium]|nr:hypothetical protein [Verrucomicrobiota bacterium]